MQRHTMTEIVNHSRSTALQRSVNILLCVCGAGGLRLNQFYVATTIALTSTVVYTKHLVTKPTLVVLAGCGGVVSGISYLVSLW